MGVSLRIFSNLVLLLCGGLRFDGCLTITAQEIDVLILGAGISGITAGNLLNNNIKNFLILEAQDCIGGRIKQVKIGNVTVGEGANWVHYVEEGADDNPILALANEIDLKRYSNNYTDIYLRNSINTTEDLEKTLKHFKEIEAKSIKENEDRNGDQPLSSTLAQNGWLPDTALKRTVQWLHVVFEFAVKPALVSSRHYSGIPEENDIVTDDRGFKGIIDHLAQNISSKIKMKKVVKQIKYSSSGIEVRTDDGETYKAKYCLCTFSTGVLASDLVKFVPELPRWKKDAISRIPLGYYTNIFARFPNVFWDDTEFIYNAGSITETFPLVYNLNKKGIHPGSNILLFTAVEDNARRIEGQKENETKAEIMKTLRAMYPNVNVPEPTEFYVGQFSQNPYIRGSFGNAVVGTTLADFHNLQGRVGNLFFSGEATSEDYWGYTQGGYLTGLKQAKVISNCLNGKECQEYEPEDADICQNTNSAFVGKSYFVFILFMQIYTMFN